MPGISDSFCRGMPTKRKKQKEQYSNDIPLLDHPQGQSLVTEHGQLKYFMLMWLVNTMSLNASTTTHCH